ncbi:MAG: serine/threonine-protein kinase [Acidimicrobiales bacterium]
MTTGPGDDGIPAPKRAAVAVDLGIPGIDDATEVGRGGFAVVYRARQPELNRTIAIKMLMARLDQDGEERFAREGWAMGTLSGHPNIVSVIGTGTASSGRPYIAMPFLREGSLADRIDLDGPLPWAEAVRIAIKLAGALETAHRSGTLHRDIKPENVLLSDYGEPLLTDFGIARVEGRYETGTGQVVASAAHASPEVLEGRSASVVSDVYALGSTLFALLDGRAAFTRRTEEPLMALYLRVARDPIADLRPRGVPDGVCRVIERAMAKDPADRQPSALEFGRQLQEVQRRAGLPVTEMALALPDAPHRSGGVATGSPSREEALVEDETGVEGAVPAEVTPAPAVSTRRRVAVGVTVAVVVVALAAAVLVATRPDGDEVATDPGVSTTTAATVPATVPAPDLPGVAVGREPTSVAANPRTNRFYVANSGSLNVSVVDGATREVTATVPMPTRPLAVAVNQRSGRVYVTTADASVVVISGDSNTVTGTVPLSARPLGLAVDHRTDRVFVATVDPVIAVIDGPTSKVVSTIPLAARPWSIAVLPDTNRAFVTSQDAGTLSIIDGGTLGVVATVPVGARPCGVVANPRNRRVYVASQDTGAVTVVDADANTVVGTVPVGSRPCGIAVNSQSNRVYVTDQETGKLTSLDGAANQVLRVTDFARPVRAPEPLPYGVEVNPQTDAVYLVDRDSNKLLTLSGDQL